MNTHTIALPSSPEFITAANLAVAEARLNPDQAIAYAAHVVPVYVQPRPDTAQATAGGCADCTYLGLWASSWPGYGEPDHGIIWMFEDGIRKNSPGSLQNKTLEVLIHELGHALDRDHVLDEMKAKGLLGPDGRPLSGHPRGCTCQKGGYDV